MLRKFYIHAPWTKKNLPRLICLEMHASKTIQFVKGKFLNSQSPQNNFVSVFPSLLCHVEMEKEKKNRLDTGEKRYQVAHNYLVSSPKLCRFGGKNIGQWKWNEKEFKNLKNAKDFLVS